MKLPRIPFTLGLSAAGRPAGRPTGRLIQSRWTHSSSRPPLKATPNAHASDGQPSPNPPHDGSKPPRVPAPIPFVPDIQTFLKLIGRDLSQHASKFPTWEALFTLTSRQLAELGIEPARERKYLLGWLQKFRLGQFGVGGDFRYVENGVARLKILENRDYPLKPKKRVVNVPAGKDPEDLPEEERFTAKGFRVKAARRIQGPYALPLKGSQGSEVTVTPGMWEDKLGRKIDGGERRRAQVRFLRRAAERRAEKEKMGFL